MRDIIFSKSFWLDKEISFLESIGLIFISCSIMTTGIYYFGMSDYTLIKGIILLIIGLILNIGGRHYGSRN